MGKNLKLYFIRLEQNMEQHTPNNCECRCKVYNILKNTPGDFSEYLLVKNRSIQSATCKLCSEPLAELNHEIINCKILLEVIDPFKTLISKLGRTETLSQQELVFGTISNGNKEQLRNFTVFIIRSTVHKSRGTVFRNQGQSIDKIINIAKQKMQKEIWNKLHLAVEKSCV